MSIAFVTLMENSWWRTAGIIEWIVGFLGAFWIFTFVGILRYAD